MNHGRRRGVTFVEVLVIVVVLAIMICLAVASIHQARVAWRRRQCTENLASIASGLIRYAEVHGVFPPATVPNDDLPPEKRLSWYVGAWSAVSTGRGELLINDTEPWDSKENLAPTTEGDNKTAARSVENFPRFRCPADYGREAACRPGPTTYVGIAGLGADAAELDLNEPDPKDQRRVGIFGYDRQTPRERITDGLRETVLLAETSLENGPWTAGGPPTVRPVIPGQSPCLGVGRQFGGLHPGGANVVFADGSGKFFSQATDAIVLARMSTIARAPGERATPPRPDDPE